MGIFCGADCPPLPAGLPTCIHKIDDMRRDENFQDLENLVDLSIKIVEIKRHKVYDIVYLLLKLVLVLPVVTVNIERVFFCNDFSKNKVKK